MNLAVHKATLADVAHLLVTMNEALKFKLSRGDTAWEHYPFTAEDIEHAIARGTTYAVLVDGQPAGRITLIWDDEHNWGKPGLDGQAGYIHSLATRDAFRGQHLGEQILDWVYAQIRAAGRPYARLDCPADNQKLCAYYERLGFERIETKANGGALYQRSV